MKDISFSTLMKHVGATVKKQRAAQAMTQRKLAHDAHVSQFYLGNIERGRANPSLGLLKRIADVLKISVSELFTLS